MGPEIDWPDNGNSFHGWPLISYTKFHTSIPDNGKIIKIFTEFIHLKFDSNKTEKVGKYRAKNQNSHMFGQPRRRH